MPELEVVCLCTGDKYNHKYVNILQAMVKRHLNLPHRFVCYTDNPKGMKCVTRPADKSLDGWWGKMKFFAPGVITNKTLYLDLDVIVCGPLDEIFTLQGWHGQRDWNVGTLNSSVMLFDPDNEDVSRVWGNFDKVKDPARVWGDQDVITEQMMGCKLFKPGWFVSYKTHCTPGIPKGAKIVVFHGRPNPHELGGWVKKLWRE